MKNCILALTIAVSVLSCRETINTKGIKLEATYPITSESSFAVVVKAYVSVRSTRNEAASIVFNTRGGEIYGVSGSAYGEPDDAGSAGLWYAIMTESGPGWLRHDSVAVFETRERAVKAAESYK